MAKTATGKMSDSFFGLGFDRILRRVLFVFNVSVFVVVGGFLLWGLFVVMWHFFMPSSWHFLASNKIDSVLSALTGAFIGMFVASFLSSIAKR